MGDTYRKKLLTPKTPELDEIHGDWSAHGERALAGSVPPQGASQLYRAALLGYVEP